MRSDSKDGGDSDAEQAARKSRFEVTASENRYLQVRWKPVHSVMSDVDPSPLDSSSL